MTKIWQIIAVLAIVALLVEAGARRGSRSSGGSYPRKPVQVVVPYNAGGGTDNFVRLLSAAIDDGDLLPQPLVVLNQPGGSGTIGSRFVKDARPDGYRILCHHESIITAQLSGATNFGPADFEPIAHSGGIELLVVVRADSPFASVRDLLEAARAEPDTVRFGANLGSPAHFTAMQLEAAHPGARFNLITAGGGQTRYISLIGGHLEAGIFSLAEYLSFAGEEGTPPDRDIRALAMLSPERHPRLPDIPTCVEQEVDATSSNAYYWWAPAGTPPAVIATLADAVGAAMQSDTVRTKLAEWSIGTEFTRGDALQKRLADRVEALAPLAVGASSDLPNFPLYLGILCALLGVFVCVRRDDEGTEEPGPARSPRYALAAACFAILVAYLLALHFSPLPFAALTATLVFLCGALIAGWSPPKLFNLALIALLCGLGSEFVFTQIFTVALP